MTGWRLGYTASNVDIAKASEKIQGQFTSGTNAVTQRAAITALDSDLTPTFKMVEQFTKRKEKVMELLKELPLLKCTEPEGAFYIFPEVKNYFGKSVGDIKIENAGDLCMYLLNTS